MDPAAQESIGSTSSGLLARVKLNEPEAWRRFVNLYSPLVYHWCRTSGLQPDDAGDVMQDVFQAVTKHIFEFRSDRPGDNLRGWLRVITRNKILDWQRRERRHPQAAGGTDAHQRLMSLSDPVNADAIESPLAEETSLLFKSRLELVRAEFEPRTWQAFWSVAVDGKNPDEVAEELGISSNAVYIAKSRVLGRFRQELDDPLLESG